MTTFAHTATADAPMGWLARAEAWLDERGKGAWIIATVLGFVAFWPLGLALLAYMIWNRKMICTARKSRPTSSCGHWRARRSSGNSAFDAYRSETLRRLEEEQENFEAFLQRLRDARDKAEFDQFMDERAAAAAAEPQPEEAEADARA